MVITDTGDYTIVVGKEPDEDQDFMAIKMKWGDEQLHLMHTNLDDSPLWCKKPVYTSEYIILYFEKERPPAYKVGDRVGIIVNNVIICNSELYKLYEKEMHTALRDWLIDNLGIAISKMFRQ